MEEKYFPVRTRCPSGVSSLGSCITLGCRSSVSSRSLMCVTLLFTTPGRSSLDALLFLREALKYCRGQPAPSADRGEWYDWPLDLLDCEAKRETWGDRSLIEAWFDVLKNRTMLFRHRFPHYSTRESIDSWLTAFATLHNAFLQS